MTRTEERRLSLVGKFLGSKIPVKILRKRNKYKCLSGGVQTLDLANGYFCFRFDCYEDLLDVWEGSPLIFEGKILVLKQWLEYFYSAKEHNWESTYLDYDFCLQSTGNKRSFYPLLVDLANH